MYDELIPFCQELLRNFETTVNRIFQKEEELLRHEMHGGGAAEASPLRRSVESFKVYSSCIYLLIVLNQIFEEEVIPQFKSILQFTCRALEVQPRHNEQCKERFPALYRDYLEVKVRRRV